MQITGETVGEVKAVADMHQRKAEMARQSDAFIALPGIYSNFFKGLIRSVLLYFYRFLSVTLIFELLKLYLCLRYAVTYVWNRRISYTMDKIALFFFFLTHSLTHGAHSSAFHAVSFVSSIFLVSGSPVLRLYSCTERVLDCGA